jgi:hypothetical protein
MVQRFYRFGDLPPRPEDLKRVQLVIAKRGPLDRKGLIREAGLTQARTLCAVDALIATGAVEYDDSSKSFRAIAAASG